MNKITVKEFVEGYINCTDSLKKRYIQEKLKVISVYFSCSNIVLSVITIAIASLTFIGI